MYQGIGAIVDFPGWTTDVPSYTPDLTCAVAGGSVPPAVQADMAPCMTFVDGLSRWQHPMALAAQYAQIPCWSLKHVAGVALPVVLLLAFMGDQKRRSNARKRAK